MRGPAAAASTAGATSDGAPPPRDFRRDIHGLRAIAVLLVLLFHSGVAPFSGGYIGVDVFFVISGYLITHQMLTSLDSTGDIALGAFYARRARRLLPASLTVLALTLLAAWICMSPLLIPHLVRGVIASALYVPNVHLARQGTDYLAETTPSAIQNYWSLGVEEQFYLVWPAVLLLAFRFFGKRQARVLAVTVMLVLLSFLCCVVLTATHPSWAFFSLPTRAWELGVGAVIALAPAIAGSARAARWGGGLSWAGLAALPVLALLLNEATPFPSWPAALPVLAAAAIIVGGQAADGRGAVRLLGWAPLQLLGTISYSLYLVHWPLQVIVQAATFTDDPLPTGVRVGLGAVAVPIAWALHRLVERPMMHWRPARGQRDRWTAGLAVAASLAVILGGMGVRSVANRTPLATDQRAMHEAMPFAPDGTEVVPANLDPSLEDAFEDYAAVYANGCHRAVAEDDPSGCRVGKDPDAPLVFLFGDSHAASWYPALELLAQEGEIQLDSNTKSSCPSLTLSLEIEDAPYLSCDRWRDGVIERIGADQPDLVILANRADADVPLVGGDDDLAARWHEGLQRTIERIEGPEVAVIRDVPDQRRTPRLCLSMNVNSAQRCAVPRDTAFAEDLVAAEDAAVEATDAHRWDFTSYLCDNRVCPTIIGDTLVYRDSHHLTATFSRQMAPVLRERIGTLKY